MNALYTLNTDELDASFLHTIKTLFPHKIVKLAVHEASNVARTVSIDSLDLMDLYGSNGISPDYDYKQARSAGGDNVPS